MKTPEEIRKTYQVPISELKSKIAALGIERDKMLAELEQECIATYGEHLDDGGMFHGFCKRCGKFLG